MLPVSGALGAEGVEAGVAVPVKVAKVPVAGFVDVCSVVTGGLKPMKPISAVAEVALARALLLAVGASAVT